MLAKREAARPLAGVALGILLLVAILPLAGAQGGFGVSPGEIIDFGAVLPGEPVTRRIVLQNGDDRAYAVRTDLSGEAASWVRLNAPPEFVIGPKEHKRLFLNLTVPEGADLGSYAGRVRFERASEDANPRGTGVDLSLAVAVDFRLNVSGEPDARLSVAPPRVSDAPAGAPFRVELRAANTGNVRLALTAEVQVYAPDETKPVLVANVTSPPLAPGFDDVVTLLVNHTLPPGQYRVNVTLRVPGEPAVTRESLLEVIDPATPRAKGELEDIACIDAHNGKPLAWVTARDIVRLEGRFRNTGDTPIVAKLKLEVYRKAQLVDVLESDPQVVDPGATTPLVAFLKKTDTPGRYEVRGHVAYAGKVTETRSTVLNVQEALPGEAPPRVIPAPAILPAIGALAAAALACATRRAER